MLLLIENNYVATLYSHCPAWKDLMQFYNFA